MLIKVNKMSVEHIKECVEKVIKYYRENPNEAKSAGAPFKAVMEEGLCCRVEKLDGTEILKTDMLTFPASAI